MVNSLKFQTVKEFSLIEVFLSEVSEIMILLKLSAANDNLVTSSEKVPLKIRKMCRFRSPCTCAKSHLGPCSPFIHSGVSNDSINRR